MAKNFKSIEKKIYSELVHVEPKEDKEIIKYRQFGKWYRHYAKRRTKRRIWTAGICTVLSCVVATGSFIYNSPQNGVRFTQLTSRETIVQNLDTFDIPTDMTSNYFKRIVYSRDIQFNRFVIENNKDITVTVSNDFSSYCYNSFSNACNYFNQLFQEINPDYHFTIGYESDTNRLSNASISITYDKTSTDNTFAYQEYYNDLYNILMGYTDRANISFSSFAFDKLGFSNDKALTDGQSYVLQRVFMHEMMHCLGASDYPTKYLNVDGTNNVNSYQGFYNQDNEYIWCYTEYGRVVKPSFLGDTLVGTFYDKNHKLIENQTRSPSIMEYYGDIFNHNCSVDKLYKNDVALLCALYADTDANGYEQYFNLFNNAELVTNPTVINCASDESVLVMDK